MRHTFEMELSLEHVDPHLIDILCEVEIGTYRGSNNTDDPSEIDVNSIKSLEHVKLDGHSLIYEGENLKIDSKLEEQIINKYERLQNK